VSSEGFAAREAAIGNSEPTKSLLGKTRMSDRA
jgi:hypothetical protein